MGKIEHQRLAVDIKRILIDIVREMRDPRLQEMITISRCEVTEDLMVAKVYVSAFGKEDATQQTVKALRGATGFIRGEISRRMHIKKSPELNFVADNGAEYAAKINDILSGLNIGEHK